MTERRRTLYRAIALLGILVLVAAVIIAGAELLRVTHGSLNDFPENCAAAGGVVIESYCVDRNSLIEVRSGR